MAYNIYSKAGTDEAISSALADSLPTTPADIGAATAAQGALADTAVQPEDLGTAAAADAGDFATAAQGAKADASDVAQITLTGNLALTVPAGFPAGQVYRAAITQDGVGGHTVTYGGKPVEVYLAAGASTPVEIWPNGKLVYPDGASGSIVGDMAMTATTSGCQALSVNAPAPLTTPTYDGTGKAVHPSVCHVHGGLGGYEWWMAMTPYATGQSVENPSILASHDGLTWVVPAGLTNPIVPALTGADFNSDTYLIHHERKLWCFYRTNLASAAPLSERLSYKTSEDGVTWSAPVLVMASNPTMRRIVSPSVAYFGGVWHLWGCDYVSSPTVLRHWTSTTTPTEGQWSAADTCTISNLPPTYHPWHIDVHRDGVELVLVSYLTVNGASAAGGFLHRAVSTDGIAWVGDKAPFLRGCAGSWDEYMYRGSALPAIVNGSLGYRLWYSALKGSADWRIGHTFVTLRQPSDRRGADIPSACWPLSPYIAGDKVDRADAPTPGTMTSGQAWTVESGSVPVVSKALSSTNGVITINPGVHGVEVGATVRAIPGNNFVFLIACKKASAMTDYVQFGMNGTVQYLASARVANTTGVVPSGINVVPAIGDRLALRIVGNDAWCLVNEMVIGRVDVSALAAYDEVGFRFALGTAAAGAYSNFYVLAL